VLPDVLDPRALARRLGNVEQLALHLGTRLPPAAGEFVRSFDAATVAIPSDAPTAAIVRARPVGLQPHHRLIAARYDRPRRL